MAVEDLDRRTIKSKREVLKLLSALKNDSGPATNDYDQLSSGYQRLWDVTCIRGTEDFELRTRLFRFVLSVFDILIIEILSLALRVSRNSYERYL